MKGGFWWKEGKGVLSEEGEWMRVRRDSGHGENCGTFPLFSNSSRAALR